MVNKTALGIQIPADLKQRIKSAAVEQGITMSTLVKLAINEYLKKEGK